MQSGNHIGLLLNDVISDILIEKLESLLAKLIELHPYCNKHKNSRGEAIMFHFGFWKKNSRINKIYEIKASKCFISKLFITETAIIWDLVSKLCKKYYPDIWDKYFKNILNLHLPYSFAIWTCVAINYLLRAEVHKDSYDSKNGICVIIPIGNFKGGNLILNEYNCSIEIKRKSIFMLNSQYVMHENEPFVGNRSSIVLFSCEDMQ